MEHCKILSTLIVISGGAYLTVWLYEKIGLFGVAIIASIIGASLFLWRTRKTRQDKEEFIELVLYSLHNHILPSEANRIHQTLTEKKPEYLQLIRLLQVLRDSIDISLSSKNRETAESRMELVESTHAEIIRNHLLTIPPEIMNEIDIVVAAYKKQFNTNLYLNAADASMDKAEKLKTDKSKIKYANLALTNIIEGLNNPLSDKQLLQNAKKLIEDYLHAFRETQNKSPSKH